MERSREIEKEETRAVGSVEFPRGPEVMKFIRTSLAIVEKGDKILIGKRPNHKIYPGKWEFPGGKIEPGETPEECISREIKEELGTEVRLTEILPYLEWDYEFPDGKSYHLIAFRCMMVGNPQAAVHAELRYVAVEELDQYDFLESDRVIFDALKNAKGAT